MIELRTDSEMRNIARVLGGDDPPICLAITPEDGKSIESYRTIDHASKRGAILRGLGFVVEMDGDKVTVHHRNLPAPPPPKFAYPDLK